MSTGRPVDLVLIGAGIRGSKRYAPWVLERPHIARFVAVAEPDPVRREAFASAHGIPKERCFSAWEDLLAQPRLGEGALVCTEEPLHIEPAKRAMELGYEVLLEKPIAQSFDACLDLLSTSERTGRLVMVCHVLRYSDFFRTLKEIVSSGRLGDIVTFEHRENVAFWHMAHTYVRGNSRSLAVASPMILSKCCHDMDLIHWNVGRCLRLSASGSLVHFTKARAREDLPSRCTDDCPIEPECPFSAVGIYVDLRPFRDARGALSSEFQGEAPDVWPLNMITRDLTRQGRFRALETGPFGRCVFHSDNDVVDHHTVIMDFERGVTGTLVMHGHSHEDYRTVRYDGTRATLRGRFGPDSAELTIHEHASVEPEVVEVAQDMKGHGGGDRGMIEHFVRVLRGEEEPLTTLRTSIESHLMAHAAEEARVTRTVIDLDARRPAFKPSPSE